MAKTLKTSVVVKKFVDNPDQWTDKAKNQLDRFEQKVLGKTMLKGGWSLEYSQLGVGNDQITSKLLFKKFLSRDRSDSQEVFERNFKMDIVDKLIMACREYDWEIDHESCPYLTQEMVDKGQNFDFDIPAEISNYFTHLYDRDSQYRLIYGSIMAAHGSKFRKRNHCLLYGKPGCGKTETLLAFEKILGPENCLKLDATATSKAGAENLLLENSQIPAVIILEEAEKCNPANLPWLLGIMDERGEIIKTDARRGSQRREARCLVLATVNDLHEFEQVMSGALASRFQHKIYFPRPNETVLTKILKREVAEINGKEEWIPPILKYLLEVEKNNDPRRAKSLLDGRDGWLGEADYLKDLLAIREAMKVDGVIKS